MLKWIFEPAPPSGARQGGVSSLHTLGTDVGIDILIREIIQNSRDRVEPGSKGQVIFTFHQLDGERKEQFLDAMSWGELEPHIYSDEAPSLMQRRLLQGLQYLYDNPLTILRIDDTGTDGLTGGEDDPGNFNALCRDTLITAEDQTSRGGSHGLGKAVLWKFSSISTVLFSSRLDGDDPRPGFRLFGRSELPSHRTPDGKRWSGPGWYGKADNVGEGMRAISVWDDPAEAIAKQAHLFRPAQLGAGTTVVIVGFFEAGQDGPRPLPEVASEVLEASINWYWPDIDKKKLLISVKAFQDGSSVFSKEAEIGGEIVPFVDAVRAPTTVTRVSSYGEVAEKSLDFRVPARTEEPKHDTINARLTLRLRRAGPDDPHQLQNRVALMRGTSGMVMAYRRPLRSPIDGQPYHAVLLAGEARGNSAEDIDMERFLRAAEPPAHNQWIHETDRIQVEYKQGARSRLRELWRDIDNAIVEMCEEPPPPSSQGPGRLAALFPLGGRGGGPTGQEKFRVDRLVARLESGAWHFSGRVTRRITEQLPWGFSLFLRFDSESGGGELIEIESLQPSVGEISSVGPEWRCSIPASVPEVTFEGKSVPSGSGARAVDVRRIQLRMDVQPSVEGAAA